VVPCKAFLSKVFFSLLIFILFRTTGEANRRRTLVDAIKQSKDEIEKTMRDSFNQTG